VDNSLTTANDVEDQWTGHNYEGFMLGLIRAELFEMMTLLRAYKWRHMTSPNYDEHEKEPDISKIDYTGEALEETNIEDMSAGVLHI